MVTGDKAWSLLESSACLFRVTGWLAGTPKGPLGQPRLFIHKYKTLRNQIPAHLTLWTVQSSPDALGIYPNAAECRKAPEEAQHIWAWILNLSCQKDTEPHCASASAYGRGSGNALLRWKQAAAVVWYS